MIDRSDLGQGRNGLFAAVCFRGQGLPLLSWVSMPAELNPSQNRVEKFCIGRLLRHLPTTIRPLLLADRGFGRASLIRLAQQMPNHTGYPVDYVIRLKGDPLSPSGGRMYRKRMQPEQYFRDGKRRFGLNRSTVTTTHRLQRSLVALLLDCCPLILVGVRASPIFRRRVCSRGKLGILNLGYECYPATPDPPDNLFTFTIHHHQTGYA